jgi:hypothetical protein
VALDLTWGDQSIRSGALPGKADLTDEWAGQQQLPAGASDQPTPTIGGVRVAGADRGPAEGLFEEAESVLNGEAPQVPAPQRAQVRRQWTADPGQPQRSWGQLLLARRSTWTRITLKRVSGAPLTWSSVHTCIVTAPYAG